MRLLIFSLLIFFGSSQFVQSENSPIKEKAYEKYMDLVKPKVSVQGGATFTILTANESSIFHHCSCL